MDLLPADMPHLCTRGSAARSSLGIRFWASTVVVDGFHTSSLYRTALNVLLLLGRVYRILPMPHDVAEERRSLARLTPSARQSISAVRLPRCHKTYSLSPNALSLSNSCSSYLCKYPARKHWDRLALTSASRWFGAAGGGLGSAILLSRIAAISQ